MASWMATCKSQKEYAAGTRIRRQTSGSIPVSTIKNWCTSFGGAGRRGGVLRIDRTVAITVLRTPATGSFASSSKEHSASSPFGSRRRLHHGQVHRRPEPAVSADVNMRAGMSLENVTSPESNRELPDLLRKSVWIREWAEKFEFPEICGL